MLWLLSFEVLQASDCTMAVGGPRRTTAVITLYQGCALILDTKKKGDILRVLLGMLDLDLN